MSNLRYLEVESTFRDRNRFPLPSQFEIPISQTGRKLKMNAVDPVCNSSPILTWSGNKFNAVAGNLITGNIDLNISALGHSSDTNCFVITVVNDNHLQRQKNYYRGAIITVNIASTGGTEVRRITEYEYLSNTKAKICVLNSFSNNLANNDIFEITDPTDLSDLSNPYFFVPTGKPITDAYVGYILYNESRNDYKNIINYDPVSHLLKTNSIPATWLASDHYNIRNEIPSNVFQQGALTTLSTVQILLGSPIDNVYNGNFVRIRANNLTGYGNNLVSPQNESRRIVKYDALSGILTVTPSFSAIPSITDDVEILPFSYDNLNPFVYSGSMVSQQQMVCYSIELINLILPNKILKVGRGNRIAFYPYVYVELTNVSNANSGVTNIIYSNNPNSSKMLFRLSINDTTNPSTSPFLKINGDKMTQTIKFKPNDNLKFSVYLPSGELFETEEEEFYSPTKPNDLIQINALFSIKRL